MEDPLFNHLNTAFLWSKQLVWSASGNGVSRWSLDRARHASMSLMGG
jgi:hypothetical protein